MSTFSPERVVNVLAVLPTEEDRESLRRIFQHCNWNLTLVRSIAEACSAIAERPIGVVLTECHLSDEEDWKDLLENLNRFDNRPPLIVTSSLADDRLWAEVLNLGGYDLLMKPFDGREVARVISLAWRAWRDRVFREVHPDNALTVA